MKELKHQHDQHKRVTKQIESAQEAFAQSYKQYVSLLDEDLEQKKKELELDAIRRQQMRMLRLKEIDEEERKLSEEEKDLLSRLDKLDSQIEQSEQEYKIATSILAKMKEAKQKK